MKGIILSALVLPALLIGMCGCSATINPPMRPNIEEELRKVDSIKEEEMVNGPGVKLEDVSEAYTNEIFERAKAVTTSDNPPETVQVDLMEVRKSAIVNNLGLKVESFNPSISEQSLRAEQGKFEAVLGASVVYSKTNSASSTTTTQQTASNTIVNTYAFNFQPSVKIPTRAGGTLNVGLPYSHIYTGSYGQYAPAATNQTPSGSITLNQPLLRGGGVKVAHASIETAGLKLLQADSKMKLATIRLLANVEQAYWNYYSAYEKLKIEFEQYRRAEQQVKLARRLVEEGVRTKVEVTRAEAGVARQFEQVLIAEANRRRMEHELRRLMNNPDLPLESETIIVPITEPRLEGIRFDREKVTQVAFRSRMDLFDNELQQAIDRVTVYVNRNALLPSLLFTFNYAFSGTKPTFNAALDQLYQESLTTYNFGLVAELPLEGNRTAKAQLRDSLLRQRQTFANRDVLRQSIHQEVLDSVDAVEKNWERIIANLTAVTLANQTYEAEVTEFQHGFRTSTDVLTALSSLADAEAALVTAISEHQKALVDLAYASGSVLGKAGVVWEPARVPE
ncbi:MAG: TolC family protein [Desulfobacteraceae bacterium]|nr:TolC family protein [Desulfobacteraceae bacterium]